MSFYDYFTVQCLEECSCFQIFTIYKAEDCEMAIMLPSMGSIYKAEVCGTASVAVREGDLYSCRM